MSKPDDHSRPQSAQPLTARASVPDDSRHDGSPCSDDAPHQYQIEIDRLPVIFYIADAYDVGAVYYQSPQVAELLGYTPEEWLQDPEFWQSRLHPDDREVVRKSDERANATGEPFTIEYRLLAKDGHVVWLRDSGVLIRESDGRPRCWQGVTADITEKKRAEERAAENERRFRTLVEQIPAVVFQNTLDDTFAAIYVSHKVEELLGYTPEEWQSDPHLWRTILHPEDRDEVLAEAERTSRTDEPFQMEYRMYARDGRVVWVREDTVLVRDDIGRPKYWQGVMFDVTEQKNLEEQLSHRARHDVLTGLPNRSHFVELLSAALNRNSDPDNTVAVLYIDLDDFKRVNDGLGHQAGDKFLRAIGLRLNAAIRADDIVARLGGDEFVVLLRPASRATATRIADRIISTLSEPVTLGDREMQSSCSIGIALATGPDNHPDDLLRWSDLAMYHAKATGKNNYEIFDPELEARVLAYLKHDQQLYDATGDEDHRDPAGLA